MNVRVKMLTAWACSPASAGVVMAIGVGVLACFQTALAATEGEEEDPSIWLYVSIPLVSAAVGWGTNVVALKMCVGRLASQLAVVHDAGVVVVALAAGRSTRPSFSAFPSSAMRAVLTSRLGASAGRASSLPRLPKWPPSARTS